MNADEHRHSLAEQAAAWVPPWARTAGAEPGAEPGVPAPRPEPAEPGAEPGVPAPRPEPVGPAPVPAADTVGPGAGVQPGIPAPRHGLAEPDTGAGGGGTRQATPDPVAAAPADPAELRGALEAILLVVDEPVTETVLAQVLRCPAELVAATLADLAAEYARTGRGFDLRRAAGGWRLYTRPEYASYVERFVLDGQQVRLTQAALETLAVVAYKQPVTRPRISAIRGVNCDGVIRTLVSRGLIEECGSEPESGAHLYRTTNLFLEKLGLDAVEQLPSLAPFLPENMDEIIDGANR